MRKIKHGYRGHTSRDMSPEYHTWKGMKQRCNNPNHVMYEYYGGRGITYDPSWNEFINFLNDMGRRPEGMTLDRIDPNGNYSKENCKWSTKLEQTQNRRFGKVD